MTIEELSHRERERETGIYRDNNSSSADRNHLVQSQERITSRLRAPPPMLRSVRCVPAYDVVSGDTYLKKIIQPMSATGDICK